MVCISYDDLTTVPTADLIMAQLLLISEKSYLVQDDMENDLSFGFDEIIPFITSVFTALDEANLIERMVYDGDLRVRGLGKF